MAPMPSFFSSFKSSRAPVAQDKFRAAHARHENKKDVRIEQSKPSLDRAAVFPRTYRTIDSERKCIRLLKLFPGSKGQPLRCTTHVISLQSRKIPHYETVSYCWGKNPGQAWIEVDGNQEIMPGSAAAVLNRLRLPAEARLLWIDAICINQCNDAEKSDQVAFMCDIYQRGHRNLIWLGECVDAKAVLQALVAVKRNIDKATNGDHRRFRALMNEPDGAETHDGRVLDQRIDTAPLQKLYQSPWFRRLWVAQEAALSRDSICHFGDQCFPLTLVLDVATWLLYNSPVLKATLRKDQGLYAARAMWYLLDRRAKADTDLFLAYILAQNFEATEPRDHVYALLGLYNDQQPHLCLRGLLLRPRYKKPLGDVFRDATRACIEDSSSLQVLQFVDTTETPAGSPSWTLRFDTGASGRDADPVFKLGNGFCADNNAPSPVMFADPNVLQARGAAIDCIGERSPSFGKSRKWETGDHAKLMEMCSSMIRERRGGNDWVGELGLTLIAGSNTKQERTTTDDFCAFLEYSRRQPRQRPVMVEGQKYDEVLFRASRWNAKFEHTMYGRRFFMTRGGLAGIGPMNMEARKDSIVILCGAPVPFVLRPIDGTKNEYKLIGACYVFGLMHGEFRDYFGVEWMSIR